MRTRGPIGLSPSAGQGRLAAALCACFVVQVACADDAPAASTASWHEEADVNSAAPPLSLEPLFAAAPTATDAIERVDVDGVAPASELATGLDVRVDQKRRRFRTGAVEWMAARSLAMGRMTDLLLGGADTGWHLVVDPTGADEYILQWKVRFR